MKFIYARQNRRNTDVTLSSLVTMEEFLCVD